MTARPHMTKLPSTKLAPDEIYPWEYYLRNAAKGAHIPGVLAHRQHSGAHELQYFDPSGALSGVLIYSPDGDGTSDNTRGEFIVSVDPDKTRKGIGTKLLAEAVWRWDIDFYRQEYTKAGRELVASAIRRELMPS